MVSSGLTSWETQVHVARSDREKRSWENPGAPRKREGRKFSVSSLLFGVSPPGPGLHPTALGKILGVKGGSGRCVRRSFCTLSGHF